MSLLQAVSPWDEGDLAAWAAAVGGGRVPVPAGAAAAGDVRLQARPDPGGGVSVLAAEHPPAASSAHCAGVRGALSRALRDPARAAGASLYRGRFASSRPSPIGSGRASAASRTLRPMGGDRPPHQRVGASRQALPETSAHTHQNSTYRPPSAPAWMAAKGYAAPEVEQAYGRARELCRAAGRDISALLGPARTGSILFRREGNIRRRGSWARNSSPWLSPRQTRLASSEPTRCLESPRSGSESSLLPVGIWSRRSLCIIPSSIAPRPARSGQDPGCSAGRIAPGLWITRLPRSGSGEHP